MTVPTLPLPGYWLLAHAILFLAAAALVIGTALAAILVGQCIAWGWKRGRKYLKATSSQHEA